MQTNRAAKHEIKVGKYKGVTNSIHVERIHSQQHRHAEATKSASRNSPLLSQVSASWCGKSVFKAGSLAPPAPGRICTRKVGQGGGKPRKVRCDRVKPIRGGGGAWRAWVSLHSEGRKYDAAFMSDLSHQYRQLSQQDLLYYKELGERARKRHKERLPSFQARKRRTHICCNAINNHDGVVWSMLVLFQS